MTTSEFELPQGTHTVSMGAGDLNGIMRGKRFPASHWPHTCREGNAFSMALLSIDMTSDVWDTPYVSFDNGYPDMHMFPITKPVEVPWEPGVAFCMGRMEGMDHKPVPIDPRQVLVRQIERAESMGFDVKVGTELEFYLLDPATGLPKDQGIQVYSLGRAAELEHVLGPIRQHINDMDIPVEQSNPEYAAGQVEVNLRYGSALQAADRVVMFRELVKQIAGAHGYLATFMAKPFYQESGSGFHVHHSLWQNNKNVFSDNGKLSSIGRQYLAGMQQRMAESAICGSSTPNAYKRRQINSFCPVNTTWGLDNRTVGLRVLEGSDAAVRIEKRDGSADCNPYFLLASDIAAGLDGIEQSLTPSAMTVGSGYQDDNAELLPTSLPSALQAARNSAFLKDLMHEHMYELYLGQAEREIAFINQQVTPVERERYLRNF